MIKIKTTIYELDNKIKPYLDQVRIDAILNKKEKPGLKAINHLKEYGFIFNKFHLYIGENLLYKVEIDKDVFYIKVINLKTHQGIQTVFSLDEWMNDDYRTNNITTASEGILHISTEAGDNLLLIIGYIIIKVINQEVISIDKTKKTYSQTSEKFSKQTKLQDQIFSLDQVIYKYARHINHCKHNITCDHWQVKGHYRHYKDGKVVYIRPYDKGKNKDVTIKDKVYKL